MARDPQISQAALDQLMSNPELLRVLRERVAEPVLADAQANLYAMGAVDSGNLHDSGKVEDIPGGFRVSFEADYAAIVHEGEGVGRNSVPRPFLANAMARDRGTIS